jgi:signal recognition particle receptor subunit beta/phosphatidylglycerophosphate synthase
MSMINYASREINCKIVYYGPGLGGKTTNLEHIYGKVQPDTRGKLISLATETERTLFFDFLPVDLGTIRGFKTRFHLYTVPGQVYYNASRKLILKGVDGIVFVADSQIERMEANQEAMQNLYDNMGEYGYDLTRMPFVVQYNKRDLPNAAPIPELQASLNPGWEVAEAQQRRVTPDPFHAGENLVEQLPTGEWVERAPYFEAVAVTGDGVFDTLKAVSKLVLGTLLDPLADTLLLLATFVPMYLLIGSGWNASLRSPHTEPLVPGVLGVMWRAGADQAPAFPYQTPLGPVGLPLWIIAIVLGRELLMTVFRQAAARRGVVIGAIGPAKWKTGFQWTWVGSSFFWFGAATLATDQEWTSDAWRWFAWFNGFVCIVTMAVAVALTLSSMWLYLQRYGGMFRATSGIRDLRSP